MLGAVHLKRVAALSAELRGGHVTNGKTIVVVDDDEAVRAATSHLLKSFGYSATSFSSAEEFLEANTGLHTLCLITDVKMPGMTGVELYARLLCVGAPFPVIFVTAFADENTKARVLAAGAHAYLTKPYEAQALMDCVESALRNVRVPQPSE